MITIFLSLVVVFLILVLSEILWNHKIFNGEIGRKFVHISVGTFVAFWPLFMSFRTIQLLSLAFLIVVLAARYLKIFHAVHVADRQTWGDFLFAVGIGLTATLTNTDWIFTVAILNLSLADGLAGVIGKHFGKSTSYKVLGQTKSVLGTATFWVVSILILQVAMRTVGFDLSTATLILLPTVATFVENFGIYGLDNVFVPLIITLVLERGHVLFFY